MEGKILGNCTVILTELGSCDEGPCLSSVFQFLCVVMQLSRKTKKIRMKLILKLLVKINL